MKPGRIPYAPEPRVWTSEQHEKLYAIVLEQMEKEFKKAFKDELTFGISGVHVDEAGDIERLDPMTLRDKIRRMNLEEGSHTELKMLTNGEIMVRYSNINIIL